MGEEKFDVEKLIVEIEKRPALWDQSKQEYSDRIKRNQNWEEITNIFADENATLAEKKQLGEVLHKKWKNIRDRYCRDLLSRRGKSGDGAKKKAPYVYAKQLSFLKDSVSHKETSDTLKEVNIEPMCSGENVEFEEPSPSLTATPSAKKRLIGKRRTNLIEEKLLSSLEAYEKKIRSDSHDDVDDNRQFLLSLVPTLASVPKIANSQCRIEIMQVLSKYESLTLQQTEQQPGYISQFMQPCYVPQAQQHPGYNTPPFQQQQGFTSFTPHTFTNRSQQQPAHVRDVCQKNNKRSLAEHHQERGRNPEAVCTSEESVQSYLNNFSEDDDTQFSII